MADGRPRDLIAEHSTREVLEVRHDGDRVALELLLELTGPTSAGPSVGRVDLLPDRALVYTDDGEATAEHLGRAGARRPSHLRPPQHPRGRVPPPLRPEPGRVTATLVTPVRPPGGPPPTGRRRSDVLDPVAGAERARAAALPGRHGRVLGDAGRRATPGSPDLLGGLDYLGFVGPAIVAVTALDDRQPRGHRPGLPRDAQRPAPTRRWPPPR